MKKKKERARLNYIAKGHSGDEAIVKGKCGDFKTCLQNFKYSFCMGALPLNLNWP